MNDSSKKLQKEDFAFEKKSKDGKKETIEELKAKNKQEEVEEREEVLVEEEIDPEPEPEPEPKRKPIKILEERDIQYTEAPPPNFSPYFTSYLHFKNSRYKEHKKLERNEFNY